MSMGFNFNDLNILIVSPEPWSHIFVSKHHYATHLAKRGNNIFFLNPPSNLMNVEKTEFERVSSVNYKGFWKGLRFMPSFIQNSHIKKIFVELEKLCKVKFDVIWSFDNSVFYNFSALPKELVKISHIVDLNQNFQIESAAKTADYCFCTTDIIRDQIEIYSNRVFKINHGFNKIPFEDFLSAKIPGDNENKAVLVGNLAMPYLDWKILFYAAKANMNVDFVFYGPHAENFSFVVNDHHRFKKMVVNLKNTYFPGIISANEIPGVLDKSDILMISYKKEHHNDQANPHKMMEYLASGKMIVATFTQEYKDLAEERLFLMSNENKEFPQLFQSAVHDLKNWNSSEKQRSRQNFALENTYDKQIERIEKILH